MPKARLSVVGHGCSDKFLDDLTIRFQIPDNRTVHNSVSDIYKEIELGRPPLPTLFLNIFRSYHRLMCIVISVIYNVKIIK